MADGMVTLTEQTFDESVNSSDIPVLVDFWAEWCGPCKVVAPILGDIARENAGKITVAKLNVDEHPSIAMRYGVQSIPTMIVFKGGRVAKTMIGAKSKSALVQELSEFLTPAI